MPFTHLGDKVNGRDTVFVSPKKGKWIARLRSVRETDAVVRSSESNWLLFSCEQEYLSIHLIPENVKLGM